MRYRRWVLNLLMASLSLLAVTLSAPEPGQAAHGSPVLRRTPGSDDPLRAVGHDSTVTALGVPAFEERKAQHPGYEGCGGDKAPTINASYEQEVLDLVNTIRADHGLAPLKLVTPLEEAARYHATDMGQDNYFEHDSYDRDGDELSHVCEWSSRIGTYYPDWASLSENIAAGYSTPESVMNGWMNSTGHRKNILRAGSWEIGVGYYRGSGSYYTYWVQDFGRRSDVYPLVINRDAASTDSRDVSLYIYGDWQEIRLQNNDSAWTAWQPFQNSMDWKLERGKGDHVVSGEMRDGATTAVTSDTIYLDFQPPALGNVPESLHFTYSRTEGRLFLPSQQVALWNVGNDETVTWAVTSEGAWFGVAPLAGTTPASFWITPTAYTTDSLGVYSGSVTVTAVDPPDTERTPQVIELTLRVVDEPFSHLHLPLVVRGNPQSLTPALHDNVP
jgi:uncharacterized protein YkwD